MLRLILRLTASTICLGFAVLIAHAATIGRHGNPLGWIILGGACMAPVAVLLWQRKRHRHSTALLLAWAVPCGGIVIPFVVYSAWAGPQVAFLLALAGLGFGGGFFIIPAVAIAVALLWQAYMGWKTSQPFTSKPAT
jgi:hypothetical protein